MIKDKIKLLLFAIVILSTSILITYGIRSTILKSYIPNMTEYLTKIGYKDVKFENGNSFLFSNEFTASNGYGKIEVILISNDSFREKPYEKSKLIEELK